MPPSPSNSSSSSPQQPKQGDNFYEQTKLYIYYILRVVSGPKILLVDDEVSRILNIAFTHSELLTHEVFVVDQIQKADRIPMKHFHCLTFLRPTQENFQAITAELELSNFKDYYLFFTNMFGVDQMQFLVRSDVNGKVKHCEEVYLDMFPVTDETCVIPLFTHYHQSNNDFVLVDGDTTNKKNDGDDDKNKMPTLPREMFNSNYITRNPMTIQQWENSDFVRVTEGMVAMALACGKRPQIRYRASSKVCSRLASEMGSRARNLQHRFFDLPSKDSVILILDRFDDPVTPLITPWTYQAICHEILGIHSGIVETPLTIKKKKKQVAGAKPSAASAAGDGASQKDQQKSQQSAEEEEYETETKIEQHVLSVDTDSFFRVHRDDSWAELCIATKDLVDAFLEINKVDLRTKSLAEIGAIGEKVPEMRQQNLTATRHSTIVSEIGRRVKNRQLSAISVLEQDLICGAVPTFTDFTTYSKRFLDAIGNSRNYSHHDALRLAILFELRHEARRDSAISGSVRQLLRQRGIDTSILDAVIALGGHNRSHQRAAEIFPQDAKNSAENKVAAVFQSFAKVLKEFNGDEAVSNVWVKHVPMVQNVLDACARGSLSPETFPFYRSSDDNANSSNDAFANRPKQILVFMVGGLTYSEALIAKRINEATRNASYLSGGGGGNSSAEFNKSSKKKNNTNSNDNNHSGSDKEEEEVDPTKIPDSLIGCNVFFGSTTMLTSENFLKGFTRR